jgi:3-dehydroquinate synthase
LKNEIGAFYQPRMTIADTAALKTLPKSELINGLGEVIKYAVIKDMEFFTWLEKNLDRILSLDDNVLETIVAKSAQIKAEIVESDEKDMGLRNILNFGHTVGHAVESISHYQVAHGKAIAIGMVAASQISVEMGIMGAENTLRLKKLLGKAGLMTGLPQIDVGQLIKAMRFDKKVQSGKIRFILPRTIGQVFITDEVNSAILEKVLMEMT